jgi:diguanylate cyclase (GGDEF)-like protein
MSIYESILSDPRYLGADHDTQRLMREQAQSYAEELASDNALLPSSPPAPARNALSLPDITIDDIRSDPRYKSAAPELREQMESGFSQYSPGGEEPLGKTNLLGSAADIGKGLLRVPEDTAASIASIFDDPVTSDGVLDKFIEWNRGRQQKYIQAPGATEVAVPGTTVTREEIRSGMSSLGYSGAAMGASFAPRVAGAGVGAVAGSAVPVVGNLTGGVIGFLAGAGSSGAAAYRMDRNSFIREYRGFLEAKEGRKITDDEFRTDYMPEQVAEELRKHGLHEAGWEGVANMLERGSLAQIAKGGGLTVKALKGLTSLIVFELGSETMTRTGQHNVETRLGMHPGEEERSFSSPSDMAKSAREVAPAVALMGGVTSAGAYLAGKAMGKSDEELQPDKDAALAELREKNIPLADLKRLRADEQGPAKFGFVPADIDILIKERGPDRTGDRMEDDVPLDQPRPPVTEKEIAARITELETKTAGVLDRTITIGGVRKPIWTKKPQRLTDSETAELAMLRKRLIHLATGTITPESVAAAERESINPLNLLGRAGYTMAKVPQESDPAAITADERTEAVEFYGQTPATTKPDPGPTILGARDEQRRKEYEAWLKKVADDDATLSAADIPTELKRAAEAQADQIVSADPVFAHMAEAKKRGGLNMDEALKDYDFDTIVQIGRRYPGIFSRQGKVSPDELASELGYSGATEMIDRFATARTKKELAAEIVRERVGEWQDSEAQAKEWFEREEFTEAAGAGKPAMVAPNAKSGKATYPAADTDIDIIEDMVRRNPENFTSEDLENWTFTSQQKVRLRKAQQEALQVKNTKPEGGDAAEATAEAQAGEEAGGQESAGVEPGGTADMLAEVAGKAPLQAAQAMVTKAEEYARGRKLQRAAGALAKARQIADKAMDTAGDLVDADGQTTENAANGAVQNAGWREIRTRIAEIDNLLAGNMQPSVAERLTIDTQPLSSDVGTAAPNVGSEKPLHRESVLAPTEQTLQDVELLRKHGDRWQYKFSADGRWMTANTEEDAVERASATYLKTSDADRLTRAQKNEQADAEEYADMDRRYRHLSRVEIEKKIAAMGGEVRSLQKAGEREFNDGGRRTAPAVAAEGARNVAEERMRLERYLKGKFPEPALPGVETVTGAADKAAPVYGQENKLFTPDAAEKARATLRAKLGQLNAGLDPEMMQAGITLAGYHIEAGARSFAAYSKAMVNDLGDSIMPFLRSFYEGVRHYPGIDNKGMSTPEQIEKHLAGGEAEAQADRRRDSSRRKQVDQMSPEEMRRELLTNHLTGLPNKRAFEEAEAADERAGQMKFKAFLDVDSLKYVNDELGGHAAGDKLLQAVADAVSWASEDAYHISGDEFIIRADTAEDAKRLAEQVNRELAGVNLRLFHENGKIYSYQGPGVSYGIGETAAEADALLIESKRAREAAGLRAGRGQRPAGVRELDTARADSRVQGDRAPAEEKKGGVDNEPAAAGVVERSRAEDEDGTVQDAGGPAAGQGRRGHRPGVAEAEPEGGRRDGGDGVSGRGSAPVRQESYSLPFGDAGSDAGDPDGGRSGTGGPDGISDDRKAVRRVEDIAQLKTRGRERDRQLKAATSVKRTNLENIRESLPTLFPEQQEDVHFIEQRIWSGDAKEERGVMLTNGTGTGKTFSGLGVVKRFHNEGKKNILIVGPGENVITAWIKAGKLFGLDIKKLAGINDAGSGIVITTYQNFYQNHALAKRDFDLVVMDESHKLLENQGGEATKALRQFQAITGHKDGRHHYANSLEHKLIEKIKKLYDDAKVWIKSDDKQLWAKANEIKEKVLPPLEAELREKTKSHVANRADRWEKQETKALFLSATPFAYEFSLDYAEGFLFHFGDKRADGYNDTSARESFYVTNFGYRMRYNKLTKPGPEVDSGLMQREFNERLKSEGAIRGRRLTVDHDYSREFVTVDDLVGQKIDELFDFVREQAHSNKDLGPELEEGYYQVLKSLQGNFDYHQKIRVLEAIKAKHAIPRIREHIRLGRKVVVFHSRIQGGAANPFTEAANTPNQQARSAWAHMKEARPDLASIDLSDLADPISRYGAEFAGEITYYNGTLSDREKRENPTRFNEHAGTKVIMVQDIGGKEGISLHDTTGDAPRVLINLGLPVRPTQAIQIEGRIYRVGQASNAVFEYFNTGTNFEAWTFGSSISQRASTAENLALGNEARALKDSFIDGFAESAPNPPGPHQGTGGKERDKAANAVMSPFQKAKTHYFANQKKTSRNKAREGADYFATPEPIGLKMVEWANLLPGQKALEPSAGHGAIGRYFPESTDNTFVEPSVELASQARLRVPGDVKVERFEDLHLTNKFDAIVMNPPFGTAGRTAIDHLAKAAKHLRNGGRIVAIIPAGPSADAKFDKWYESDEARDLHLRKIIHLPSVTFSRAATSVRTRVVIIDKLIGGSASTVHQTGTVELDAETINDLFDRIEDIEAPDRPDVKAGAAEILESKGLKVERNEGNEKFPWKVTGDTWSHKITIKYLVGEKDRKWDRAEGAWIFKEDPTEKLAAELAPESAADEPMFSRENRSAWPDDFPNATTHTTLQKLKAHPDYAAAKAGDIEAAYRVVNDLVKRDKVKAIAAAHPDAVVVAAHAEEEAGRNAIPRILAEEFGAAGLEVNDTIIQTNKPQRTKKGSPLRLALRPEFAGEVEPGREYILIDDAIGQGGTIAELRFFIESNGGKVVNVSALTSGIFGNKLKIESKTVTDLEKKFGREQLETFLDEFNTAGRIEALTEKEGRFILKQLSLDSLRDRILAEAREAGISPSAWQKQALLSRLAASSEEDSSSTPTTDTTPEQVLAELRDFLGSGADRLERAGKLQIVRTGAGLPESVKKSEQLHAEDGRVVGTYHQGKVYLVVDRLQPGDARYVFIHEGAHALLSEDPLFSQQKQRILSRFTELKGRSEAVKMAYRMVPESTPAKSVDEEALAYFLQNPANHQHNIFQRVVSAIKAALVRLGVPVEKLRLTEADFVALFTGGVKRYANRAGVKESFTAGESTVAMHSRKRNTADAMISEILGKGVNVARETSVAESILSEAERRSTDPKAISKWFNRLSRKAQEGMLPVLTLRQLRDIFAKDNIHVARFYQGTRDLSADANNMMSEADEIYNEFAGLDKKEADETADIMTRATVAGVDPAADKFEAHAGRNSEPDVKARDKQREAAYNELRPRFEALSPDAKGVYVKVRDQYTKQLHRLRNALLERLIRTAGRHDKRVLRKLYALIYSGRTITPDTIANIMGQLSGEGRAVLRYMDQIRLKFEGFIKEGPYFPLARFGKYQVIAEKGKEYVRQHFETLKGADDFVDEMKRAGYRTKVVTAKEYNRSIHGVSNEFAEGVVQLIDASDMEKQEKAQILDDLNQLFILSMPDLSHRKHFVHRQKTEGYSRDQLRAFADNMMHSAHHISRIKHADKLTTALRDMEQDINKATGGDFALDMAVFNELSKRHDMTLNPNISPVSQAITALGFAWNIGPSIASAMVNLSQTPLVAFPILGARYGARRAAAALKSAGLEYIASPFAMETGFDISKSKRISDDERKMLDALIKDGTIDVTQVHSLAQAASPDYLNMVAKTKYGAPMLKAMRIVSYPFHVAEVANRQITALAAYRLARKTMNHREAVLEARETTLDSHFDYSRSNRARFMEGNMRRVLFLFKQYSQQMTFLLGRSFQQAIKGADPQTKRIARNQLIGILGGHFLMAGAMGLPVLGTIADAMQFFASALGDEDEPWEWETEFRNYLADHIGTDAGEAVARGPWRLLPFLGDWDVSSRVSLGDLWFRAPNREKEGRDAYYQYLDTIMGPISRNVGDAVSGLYAIGEGRVGRGVEMMMPKAIKDAIKTTRYARDGLTSWNGEALMEDLRYIELFGQFLGFTPARVAEMYSAKSAIKNKEYRLNKRREFLVNNFIRMIEKGDMDRAQQFMDKMVEFGQKNPEFMITEKTLEGSMMGRMRTEALTERGVYLPASKEQLREEGRFGNF